MELIENTEYQYISQKMGPIDLAAIVYYLVDKLGGRVEYLNEDLEKAVKARSENSEEIRLRVPVKKDLQTGNVVYDADGQFEVERGAKFVVEYVKVPQQPELMNPNIVPSLNGDPSVGGGMVQ